MKKQLILALVLLSGFYHTIAQDTTQKKVLPIVRLSGNDYYVDVGTSGTRYLNVGAFNSDGTLKTQPKKKYPYKAPYGYWFHKVANDLPYNCYPICTKYCKDYGGYSYKCIPSEGTCMCNKKEKS